MADEKKPRKRGGYVMNKKVFRLAVRVEDDETRQALLDAAGHAGSDIKGRNLAIQSLLEDWNKTKVGLLVGIYRAKADRLAVEAERRFKEAEAEALRAELAAVEEKKRRLAALEAELDGADLDPADPAALDVANERPIGDLPVIESPPGARSQAEAAGVANKQPRCTCRPLSMAPDVDCPLHGTEAQLRAAEAAK